MKYYITNKQNDRIEHEDYNLSISIARRKLLYNVGVYDVLQPMEVRADGKRVVDIYYQTWKSMLVRVFDNKYQERNPTYVGCTIIKEWLIFSNFKAWMVTQDWEGKQLDKDIITPENKQYNPESCVFVHSRLNKLLSGSPKDVKGVHKTKLRKPFRAIIYANGRTTHLGYFDTEHEASRVYITAKIKAIETAICNYEGNKKPKVIAGLRQHIKELNKLI